MLGRQNQQAKWIPDPGGFLPPAAPRFFAGNQTGKATAAGSNRLEQPKACGELASVSVKLAFYVFSFHVSLQLSGRPLVFIKQATLAFYTTDEVVFMIKK